MSGSPSKLIRMKEIIDEERGGDAKYASSGWDQVLILSKAVAEKRLRLEEGENERARVAAEEAINVEVESETAAAKPLTVKAKAGTEAAAKPQEGEVIKETSRIPSGPTLATPGPSASAPRRTASPTVPKIPAQRPKNQSAWSRDPPQTASSSRSQSPAPQNTPVRATHSRRPSTLGQGIHIKVGVSIPRNNVGATKQGPAVSFGSIDDVSALMSSSPAATPPIKSEGVKTSGTAPATVSQANGKSSVSIAKPGSSSSRPYKPRKQDIAKLFQNLSSALSSQASSGTSSPNIRASNLPSSSQPPSIPSSSHPPYTSFVPQNGMRPQQPHAGPNGGATGSGPRSPQYQHQRQVPNGNPPRIPSGPGGPGAPQMSAGLGSPHMTPHPPPENMPPPMQTQMSWPPNYYYMGDQPYIYPWYPMQQHQMPPQPPQHHPQPPGGHIPPHNGIPVSPRNHPPPLQGPGTPTLTHAAPAPHPPHLPPTMSHSSSGSIGGLSSPPPTPSSASIPGTGRLITSASAFVPGQRSSTRVPLKNADGTEINLENLKNQKVSPALSGSALPPVVSPAHGSPNCRSVIRKESEEERSKRLAGEREKKLAKAKAEADSKAKKEKEENERREKEEKEKREEEARERKEKDEKERLEKEAKERLKKEEEEKEKEKERLRLEEEERKKAEEETERKRLQQEQEEEEKERIRLEKKKKEKDEQKEHARIAEEEAAKVKVEAEAAAAAKPEEGEVIEETSSADADATVTSKDKAKEKDLRINTTSPPSELPRRRPGPLDLSSTKTNIPAPLPSALATARIIDDLGRVPYPEGIKSPKVELNINAKDGKFRYDRDFLLQFMSICKEKPESLPALDAIGLEPSEQMNYPMSRGGSGRHRQGSGAVPPQRQNSTSLGFNPGSSFGKGGSGSTFSMGGMGNFATSIGGSKLNSDDRFNMSNNMRAVSASGAAPMPFGNRPSQMQRTASQGGPGGAPMGSNRTRSKRGEKRNDSNRVPTGPGSQHGYNMGHGSSAALVQSMLEPVAPLQQSANRWDKRALGANDPDSPDVVDRKVKGLLNKLMMEKFDSISDQIIAWANKSEKEKDGRTLIQVIHLVLESATDEATWSEMYARLCRKMMEQISPKVQDDGIKNTEGKPITGGQLFRKYLLNKCREDFERGWVAKEATAAAAASKTIEDQAAKAPAEKKGDGEEEVALYSEEYHAAQKAKRHGLGLIKFIGELFKLQMLTERIMHECVKKLLWNVENPEEGEIESLCTLLTTVGQLLDTAKARAHMDVYFSRMKELMKSPYVSLRMQFMLQDIIELRERKWISRDAVDAPTTIAQIHAAGKEKAAQEKESYQRQTSMSRSGSRRGGERGEFPQVGADGWAVAGAPWSPSKAGDLSKFGQISDMTVPATLRQVSGKSSVSIVKPGSSSNTLHKPRKQDIAKLFYNPPSAPPSQASSDTSPSNIRPSDLPPSSQPTSIPSSSHPPYPSFLPQNGMRPQQPNAGPNGDAATSSGPRSPQYQWQVPNGNAPHIPSGPGGHIPVADKKHKAAERELLKTEEEEREKECLQPEVEERKNAEEGTKRLQQEEEEKEPAEEEVVKAEVEATSHPSALATARIIDDLGRVPYPEGIRSPRVELNINAMDGEFIYDREFLLQFMPVCKEKPESLAAPDAISLKPSDHINYGQHRQGSGAVPSQHQTFTTGEPEFGQTSNKGTPITFGPQSSIYAGKKDTEPKPINMRNKNLKIKKIIKKFSAVRNLDEAEVYFTQVPAKHHPLLVAKLMSFAVKSEADAQLVAELFSRASTKNLCTIADFESGFAAVIELLDGIAIDAPMAFKLMATMMKGPAFDDEQRTRLASKTGSAKLLGLLS